jgi:hypothetical protein
MERHDEFLPPGTRVRLDSSDEPEYGIVIHCWMDPEIDSYDCYVAFFGDRFPAGRPPAKPYVLRYAVTSLTVLASPESP